MSLSAKASSLWVALLVAAGGASMAQTGEGGLYVAGAEFSFQRAAERGLAQNPGGRRFFLLTLPPQAGALRRNATPWQTQLRDRVIAGNGVLLVCQRDLDNGRLNAAQLVPEVVPVRGWPPKGSTELPLGERYFPGEDRSTLPASTESLRKLRSICS
jgi:hypothetical protein